jgi:hypothetical protein
MEDGIMLDYMSVQDAAIKWNISERRIQKLCEEKRINGVIRFGRSWAIPKNAKKPADGRMKENREKKKLRKT